jgi:hypothetical protein
MSVEQSAPPPSRASRSGTPYDELVDKALANRNQWFSVAIPPSDVKANVYHNVRAVLVSRLQVDVTVRQGTIYIKVEEDLV